MKFIITRASSRGLAETGIEIRHKNIAWDPAYDVWVIEIGSVYDMSQLVKHYDHPIIIDNTSEFDYSEETRAKYPYMITVYDDYVE